MTASPAVRVDRSGSIVTLSIDRPEALNAINAEVHEVMGNALVDADTDPEVRVIVVTGTGERSFSAGADLKALGRGESLYPAGQSPSSEWRLGGFVRNHVTTPIIAAVNGLALGGGLEIVLASDLAIAADHATFGLPEVRHGLLAGAGGIFRLIQQAPHKFAMEMLLTGNTISAEIAHRWGLVNKVVPAPLLLATAHHYAKTIANNGPNAVRACKALARGIHDGRIPAEDPQWEYNDQLVSQLRGGDEEAEGLRAFTERRSPAWTETP
jgi:crotonobetainyl-CoA hydratase